MIISHGLTGLGDLGSVPRSGGLNKPANVTASQVGKTSLSDKVKVQQSLNNLLRLTAYDRNAAAGSINTLFQKRPSSQSVDDARAQYEATAKKVLGSKAPVFASSPSTALTPTTTRVSLPSLQTLFGAKPLLYQAGTPTAAPVISPPVQAAAAAIQAQQSALTSTGGGGGGGGGADLAPADASTDTGEPEPTGWAALSGGQKAAIIGGGVAAVVVTFYLIKRRHRS